MKDFVKIVLAILCVVVCVLLLDFAIGFSFDRLRHNLPMDGERTAKAEYVINKVDADIVIIGSSRAQVHYDTYVFRDSLPDYSVFNCGGDGQKFWYCDIVINCILDRYTPKLVIWDFLLNDLECNNENLSLLYPYYKENEYIRERLLERNPELRYQLWLNSYRYNGSGSRILTASRLPKNTGVDKLGYSGHKPLSTVELVYDEMKFDSTTVDSAKVVCLERTLEKAKSRGVKVVLAVSPVVNRIKGYNSTIETLRKISEIYDVPFINDSQLEGFVDDPSKGYDSGHLNSDAAREYTIRLIQQIRQSVDSSQ